MKQVKAKGLKRGPPCTHLAEGEVRLGLHDVGSLIGVNYDAGVLEHAQQVLEPANMVRM